MRYLLSEHGRVFSTRNRGERVRRDFLAKLNASLSTPAVIDLHGVTAVSHSFADEFIGKLMQELSTRNLPAPALENADAAVKHVIDDVLTLRGIPASELATA